MAKLHPEIHENDHQKGSETATVTLTEYGDYQCPYCGEAHPVVQQIQETFGDKLRFVFRNFPLSNVHPRAMLAAIATEAAAKQNVYWEMHDLIFEHQDAINYPSLVKYAANLNIDVDAFKADLDDPALQEKVESDFESGIRSGVNRTPSFFINGEKYEGTNTFEALKDAISAVLYLNSNKKTAT